MSLAGREKSPAGGVAAPSDDSCIAMGTPIVRWEDLGGALSVHLMGHSVFATLDILLLAGAMDNQWAMRRLDSYMCKRDADGTLSFVERAAVGVTVIIVPSVEGLTLSCIQVRVERVAQTSSPSVAWEHQQLLQDLWPTSMVCHVICSSRTS